METPNTTPEVAPAPATTVRLRATPNRRANTPAPPLPPQAPRPVANADKRGITYIKDELMKRVEAIQAAIPQDAKVSAQGIINNALTIIMDNNHLKLCTPRSVVLAVLAAARFGFSFCGDDAYLIPYDLTQDDGNGNRVHKEWIAQFQPGYRGLIDVAFRHGYRLYAQDVWEKDQITLRAGTAHSVDHIMCLSNRGQLVGAYCLVSTLEGKTVDFSRICYEEVALIRRDTPAWKYFPGRMAARSAITRAFKRLPRTDPEIKQIMELDDMTEQGADIGTVVDPKGELVAVTQ
jgi:phage RecT family recombinase